MDDVVSGAVTEEEALRLYVDSRELLKSGAFNLRKFKTNLATLQQKIDAEQTNAQTERSPCLEESHSNATLGQTPDSEHTILKVLGVGRQPSEDLLHFSVSDIVEAAGTTEPTKRNVVRLFG